jgi:quinohemoprotein ethanol dehydrogenase
MRLALVVALACAATTAGCGNEDALPPPLTGTTETVSAPPTSPAPPPPATTASAPAFSGRELAQPSGDWPTNGGNSWNMRYSPLRQITTSNVRRLKPVWRIHLLSGAGDAYSGESSPVVYRGVIYVTTGENDVFAIAARSGRILWKYDGGLSDVLIHTLCCARTNRGVAIGDGKVFETKLDNTVVALDQRTGREVWHHQLARWQDGFTMTSAPLYFDGRLITGISGGEYGIRGRVYGLDADTGREVWRFYTIPGPGQPGHDTWPQTGDAWKHGGAPMWQTPALDPDLGLLYFGTGNTGPLFNGAERKGANLYANSTVAIDARTGKLRWARQHVHHDLWDYDAATPVVLFDLTVHGRPRKAVAQSVKTGWVYVLDRETGKPLLPIPERPVPQDPRQATWPTQPMPKGDPFVPQSISPAEVAKLHKAAPPGPKPEWTYRNGGRIFTPGWGPVGVIAKPSTMGGTDWPPSSYNPDTGYLYVCASDTISIFSATEQDFQPRNVAGGDQFLGSAFAAPAGAALHGVFAAMDMRTNTVAWSHKWDETNADDCYSGSATTAGGLVFVGRNDGRLIGYDARTGDQVWDYQTGAGANAPPAVFDDQGTESVVLYSGGNALAGSPHGDIVTLFSLRGTLPPAPPPR